MTQPRADIVAKVLSTVPNMCRLSSFVLKVLNPFEAGACYGGFAIDRSVDSSGDRSPNFGVSSVGVLLAF
jgi:hypothetical protein